MEKVYFVTEKNAEILHDDFLSLRTLYTPVIGKDAVFLFTLLNDYHYINKTNMHYIPLEDLGKVMDLDWKELLIARKKLEAVGLIRTFEKSSNKHLIMRINKPLTPTAFRNNSLLYKEAMRKIDDIIFERVEFAIKQRTLDKSDFKEVSIKFQDIFSLKQKEQQSDNTLTMAVPSSTTKEDAIKGLNFAQFIFYITGKKISPSQLSVLSTIQNSGLSNKSINIIVDYSFNKNGRIVTNHIKKIAEDLISKGVSTADAIYNELNYVRENVAQEAKETIELQQAVDKVRTQESETTVTDWEDMFESLGGL